MILRKNSVNTVSLTLVEKTTLPNPYYLFEFQNIYTRKKYFQIFTDVSISGEARIRANEFNIEVVDSGSGANKIILGDIGQYNYTIYEQVSDSNLNPANTTSIVERREMRLLDSEATIYVEHEIEIEYTTHEQ
jgi:hypothetical protein